jgi:hypothetical protein
MTFALDCSAPPSQMQRDGDGQHYTFAKVPFCDAIFAAALRLSPFVCSLAHEAPKAKALPSQSS